MSKIFIEESTLTAIGDAIREKTGKVDLLSPAQMAIEITDIQTGGAIEALDITSNGTYNAPEGIDGYNPITVNVPQDGSPPEEAFHITGNCSYKFANGGWDWFVKLYGDRVTTSNIDSAPNMFYNSQIEALPFDLNFKSGGADVQCIFQHCRALVLVPTIDFNQTSTYKKADNIFSNCHKLRDIGTISNLYPDSLQNMFYACYELRNIPEFVGLNLERVESYKYSNCSGMFGSCYSLRSIPEDFLKGFKQPEVSSYFYPVLYNGFTYCYALDEVVGLNPQTGVIGGNIFTGTFSLCGRLKNIIFAKQDDGTPYTVSWKTQVINISNNIGHLESSIKNNVLNYNSGITADKEVTDDASYQALKDDPDWFTINPAYSRYNHDSAVATINSLPDTSAYLATAGGTNTITFKGEAGSATDGGAINTLTEAEIAVATAKGWTVTLV